MADISQYLQDILDAVYGEQVRGSIHDAIEIINDVSEVVLTLGTAVDSPSSSSTGFFTNSLYLNTNSYVLWKCVGTDSWASQGVLKGAPGVDGNKWYRGTGISGKAANPTVYSGSGIALANPNDFYLNPVEGAVYYCVTGGNASTATWSYDFTMTGGGGSTYTAGNGIDPTDLAGGTITLDYGTVSGSNTTKPVTGKAVNDALPTVYDGTLTIQQNGTTKATHSANTSTNSTANIITGEFIKTASVSAGSVTFTGVDDSVNSGGCGYDVFFDITSGSTNKAPYAKLTSISGEGTNSCTLTYETDADNGTNTAHLYQYK